jgi:hypothetical protein
MFGVGNLECEFFGSPARRSLNEVNERIKHPEAAIDVSEPSIHGFDIIGKILLSSIYCWQIPSSLGP